MELSGQGQSCDTRWIIPTIDNVASKKTSWLKKTTWNLYTWANPVSFALIEQWEGESCTENICGMKEVKVVIGDNDPNSIHSTSPRLRFIIYSFYYLQFHAARDWSPNLYMYLTVSGYARTRGIYYVFIFLSS